MFFLDSTVRNSTIQSETSIGEISDSVVEETRSRASIPNSDVDENDQASDQDSSVLSVMEEDTLIGKMFIITLCSARFSH